MEFLPNSFQTSFASALWCIDVCLWLPFLRTMIQSQPRPVLIWWMRTKSWNENWKENYTYMPIPCAKTITESDTDWACSRLYNRINVKCYFFSDPAIILPWRPRLLTRWPLSWSSGEWHGQRFRQFWTSYASFCPRLLRHVVSSVTLTFWPLTDLVTRSTPLHEFPANFGILALFFFLGTGTG